MTRNVNFIKDIPKSLVETCTTGFRNNNETVNILSDYPMELSKLNKFK